jgi:hypothetical protein
MRKTLKFRLLFYLAGALLLTIISLGVTDYSTIELDEILRFGVGIILLGAFVEVVVSLLKDNRMR